MRPRALLAALALVVACAPSWACGGESSGAPKVQEEPIRIGTKDFTEQFLLGELYAQALRAEGFPVDLKRDIGNSEIVHRALLGGGIDLYPEYVGVLLSEVAGVTERPKKDAEAYELAKRFEERNGNTLLAPTPFSNQNALAVLPTTARRERVRTVGDLDDLPGEVVIGAPPEFATRFEGLTGLQDVYGLEDVTTEDFAIGRQYDALDAREIDAAAVFTTDGRLAEGDYVLLEDPRGLFASQPVAPVVGRELLARKGPRLANTLNAVSARLTTEVMRRMNAEVDRRGREPAEVAAQFLRSTP